MERDATLAAPSTTSSKKPQRKLYSDISAEYNHSYKIKGDDWLGGVTMNYCPNCGKQVKADEAYCSKCGKALVEQGLEQIGVDLTSDDVKEAREAKAEERERTRIKEDLKDVRNNWWGWGITSVVLSIIALLGRGNHWWQSDKENYLFWGILAVALICACVSEFYYGTKRRKLKKELNSLGRPFIEKDTVDVTSHVSEDTVLEDSKIEEILPEVPRCPICGSETVIRTAKQGPNAGIQFNVCTRYPECKGKFITY